VLSRLFRRLYLEGLETAYRVDEVELHGQLGGLRDPTTWTRAITEVRRKEWVVYAKPPFGGPTQVLKYLARYTHRVAISNQRIVTFDGERVCFRWRDRSAEPHNRTMELSGVEFVRRFLLHVLPKGFVRIRHFGFLANRVRTERIALARRLLHLQQLERPLCPRAELSPARMALDRCPSCRTGRLVLIGEIPPAHPVPLDTS
jgi:hypothetical protein